MLFPGFQPFEVERDSAHFADVAGGCGPVVALLHDYPQTHIAPRHIAPSLAALRTVVVPDLPGYGTSKVGISVFTPTGAVKKFIPVPEDTVTNFTFASKNMRTVYFTAGKMLFRFENDTLGLQR